MIDQEVGDALVKRVRASQFKSDVTRVVVDLSEATAYNISKSGDRVRVHFDTGNIMMYQFPEHWSAQLGARTKNVHLKEFTKKGTDVSLEEAFLRITAAS